VITGSREDASDPNPNRKTTPSEEGKSPTAKPANEVITGFGVGLSVEKVEEARIEMTHISGTVVAQIMIELV
jgi:hypothetical protein